MKQGSWKKWLVALAMAALLLILGVYVGTEEFPSGQTAVSSQAFSAAKHCPTEQSSLAERLSGIKKPAAVEAPEQLFAPENSAEEQTPAQDMERRPADQKPDSPEAAGPQQLTCTLSIRCETILDNLDQLAPEKRAVLPEDGLILAETSVTFYAGESVFDVLLREMQARKIHLEFENTPMYQSTYIEGIHNLYEFDCGDLSGWMYRVNGWFPNYGCSRYYLQDGDQVEWLYTCDLGRDIGDNSMAEEAS